METRSKGKWNIQLFWISSDGWCINPPVKSWDDIRYFLAVARGGSVRAAAEALKVNHSTVLRRIAQLEKQLESHVFEKFPSGYQLTTAGAEILELAEEMEAISSKLETRVYGRDQSLTGILRVALPPSLATNLLMSDLAEFSERHPEIQLELLTSYEPVNLTKRQADVALRLVYDREKLPPHLFGLQLQQVHRGVYLSHDLLTKLAKRPDQPLKWLLKAEDGAPPTWATPGAFTISETIITFSELQAQIVAAKASMGLAVLPCFIGDADPLLVRVPASQTHLYGTLWLLTHGETRMTKRVRLFGDFIQGRLSNHAQLLAGLVEFPRT